MLSSTASNAIIYTTYSVFLVFGLLVGFRYMRREPESFLGETGMVSTFNFIAAGMSSSVLFGYPELGTIAGVLGATVYALASALPLLSFAYFGSIIRKRAPKGFVLGEFILNRFGLYASLFYAVMSLVTMFIYLVAELTAIGEVISTMAGVGIVPAMVCECVFTAVYTCVGGFKVSLITDNVQGSLIVALIVICACAIGTKIEIKPELVHGSGLLAPTRLGWQLLYILPVAIVFNDYFLAGFWQRTFASKNDKHLWGGCIMASIVVFIVTWLLGFTGVIAAWSGVWHADDPDTPGSIAFFLILAQMPNWVVGLVLVFAVCVSMAAYDTLQTAIVTTVSHDIFHDRLPLIYCRIGVFLLNGPAIALAIRNANVLVLYLISDLLSACVMPAYLLGLWRRVYFFRGVDCIVSGLGGVLSVWVFFTIYYDSPQKGGDMLINLDLYANDWGAFGGFMVAPGFGTVFYILSAACRWAYQYVRYRVTGRPITFFDRGQDSDDEAFLAETGSVGVAHVEVNAGGK